MGPGEAAARADADRAVLVVPIVPAASGNGLAMRAGMVLDALAARYAVDLVIVPVSGPVGDRSWAEGHARSVLVVDPAGAGDARAHVIAQLADPILRERLQATAPLPTRATLAPPTLADEIVGRSPALAPPRVVWVLRGYLAPLGITLARRLGAPRVVVDVDDDDEAVARAAGDDADADAFGRLSRAWLPDADIVCGAAHAEVRGMAARHGLRRVAVLPNAVRLPADPGPPPGDERLLFVGNLTYAPNQEAARVLADEVLPLVRRGHPAASVDLVGPHDRTLRGGEHVRVAGMVGDLAPWYAAADVVVVPLRRGGGTRIKVLEAFAHRRAVVATPVAVAGLELRDGRDVLVGRSSEALAGAVGELLDDPSRRERLARHAYRTLTARYVHDVVAPLVRGLAEGAPVEAARGESEQR